MNDEKQERRLKLLNKIQALLNKADTGRGATEEEAKTFLAKAQELMLKHGTEEMEIANLVGDDGAPAYDMGRSDFLAKHERRAMDLFIGDLLRKLFGVHVIYGYHAKPNGSSRALRYIICGDQLDRDMAKIALPIIHDTMKRGYNRWLRENGLSHKVGYEQSFCRGLMQGYLQASEEGKALYMSQLSKEQKEQYGLILADKKEAVTAYVKEAFPNLGTVSHHNHAHDHAAGSAGFNEGSRMKIFQKNLSGSNPNKNIA